MWDTVWVGDADKPEASTSARMAAQVVPTLTAIWPQLMVSRISMI